MTRRLGNPRQQRLSEPLAHLLGRANPRVETLPDERQTNAQEQTSENAKYHVRGYAVVDGFTAWIVYFGYKVNRPINTAELGLAARSVQTVIPHIGDHDTSTANLASATHRGE